MIDITNIVKEYETKQIYLTNPRQLKSGKEAVVFVVFFKDKPAALKVYKDPSQRAFQDNQLYLEGKFYNKPSFRKAVAKKNRFGRSLVHKDWVKREFFLLEKLFEAGVAVPKPLAFGPTSILMEFIGDNEPAPRLIDVELTSAESKLAYAQILKSIEIMLEIGIVHSDLSPYNILWWNNKPYIIDFPQAVDIRNNPNKDMLLKRDVDNITSYFSEITSSRS